MSTPAPLLVNNTTARHGTSTVAINTGGTLRRQRTVSGAITLNSGGFIQPGAVGHGVSVGTLSGTTLTWNGAAKLNSQLGTTSDLLALTGALTKARRGPSESRSRCRRHSQPDPLSTATFVGSGLRASDFTWHDFPGRLNGFSPSRAPNWTSISPASALSGSISKTPHRSATPVLADFTVVGVGTPAGRRRIT